MRYVVDFGSANAGLAPAFSSGFFKRLDTLADVTAPTIVEIANGEYYFDYAWETAPAGLTAIAFKVILGGIELADVITASGVSPTRYLLDFGSVNTGGSPAFTSGFFRRLDTLAAITAPTLTEISSGVYYFDYVWSTAPAGVTSIAYKAIMGGTEVAGTITSPLYTGQQTLTLYPTALTVLNRAAAQCTLAQVADPYAETNPDWVLMRDLLVSLGREILKAPQEPWTHLVRSNSFVTDGVSYFHTLPGDYRAMVDNTLWNRSTRLPGIGPMTSQQRAALQARLVSIVLNVSFRIDGNVLTFPILPPSGQTVAYDYYSTFWVQSTSGAIPDKDRPTASTDVLLFDEELLVTGLVLRFLENRGYDTVKAQERFNSHLEDAIGRNVGGSVISLTGQPHNVWDRMLGADNVPAGNWPA